MRGLSALSLFLLCGLSVIAQSFDKYNYEAPAQVPEVYKHDPLVLYDQILNQTEREAKKKHLERYAELVAFGVSEDFEQGRVYMGWEKAESYLNAVFDKLIKEVGGEVGEMKIYFMRSPALNAYTKPNGSLYITSGLIAELEDEAALACVLGHEIDHYLEKDGEQKFFDNLKNFNRKNRNTKDIRLEMAHENQAIEHRCDRFGWTLARDAGYRMESFRSHLLTFALNSESSKNWNRRLSTEGRSKENDLNYLLASHPEAAERLDSLEKFIEDSKRSSSLGEGKAFIVDEQGFKYLKYQSKLQVLELFKERNHNMAMFERGFAYLLLTPDNPYYLQYTLEALRRVMYFEPERIKLRVLNDYYPHLPDIQEWDKLLANMMKYPERIKEAEKSVYLQKFEKVPTYKELLAHLEEQVMTTGNTEGFLSLALYYHNNDKKKFDRYIDHYISLQNIKHKTYAELLKNNGLREGTGEQDFFVLDEIVLIEDHYYGLHRRDLISRKMNASLVKEIEPLVDDLFNSDYKTVAISELQQNNLKRYLAFKNISNTVYFYQTKFEDVNHSEEYDVEEIVFTSSGSKTVNQDDEEIEEVDKSDLFEYSPETWELYRDQNMSSLHVAYGKAFDERGQFWRVLFTCCTPYSSLVYFISNGSKRYEYRVGYMKVDLKEQKYEDVNDIYHAKFTTNRYVKKLRKLIKSTR